MMQYPQITIPPRSEHLWRYTPWKRIHPTKVEEMPKADPIKFSQGEEFEMADSEEIARAFIHSIAPICRKRLSSMTSQELDLRCSGHICAGELSIESKGHSTIVIRISGDAGWTGLRVTGSVSGNLSIAYINDLANDAHFLRCEDWDVLRDSTLEFATLIRWWFPKQIRYSI